MVSFNVESWIWYAVVIWIALSRFISRRLALGSFIAFQVDDYFMLIAICFYTALIVTINIVAVSNSNLLPPGVSADDLSQEDIQARIYGSKLVLVVEECQCCVVWAAKACVITMYLRFTVLARENLLVKILAGYIAGGFVLMQILYLGVWCRPFYEYWAVPTDNVQCDAATNHLITNAVLNLSSDLAMLLIGLPIFFRVQLPLRQKVPVVLLFSLGVFVIIAAILNKIYSFSDPFGTEWVFWYVRESSTALIVANLPFVWTLYRRIPGLRPSVQETVKTNDMLESLERPAPKFKWRRSRPQPRAIDMNAIDKSNTALASTEFRDIESAVSGMTAEEMLRGDYMLNNGKSDTVEVDVNPYTHPALFCALERQKKAQQAMNLSLAPISTSGSAMRDNEQPGSRHETDALVNSPYHDRSAASMNRRSMGSFV